MEKLKLKIKKVVTVNPTTKQKGYAARVITNGTAVYTDIMGEATRRTTLHVAEAKLAAELLVEEIAAAIKGATLAWHKEAEEEETEGTDTPAPTDTPSEGGPSDAGSGGDGGLG